MSRTIWILASALCGCGIGGTDNNVIPIDATSEGSSGDMTQKCGDVDCNEGEVCIEDESQQTDQPASQRCASVGACPVMPPTCDCVEPLCEEGQDCVQVGLVPGMLFRCETPEQ